MAEKKPQKSPLPKGTKRRRKPAGVSVGLAATELLAAAPPGEVAELHRSIEQDGGKVLSVYREPYGGRWVVMAALPIDLVEPTPYQRNLSDAHARKLEAVIGKIGRFLDPIIAVRAQRPGGSGVSGSGGTEDSVKYWTPNGHHRLAAMKTLQFAPGLFGMQQFDERGDSLIRDIGLFTVKEGKFVFLKSASWE